MLCYASGLPRPCSIYESPTRDFKVRSDSFSIYNDLHIQDVGLNKVLLISSRDILKWKSKF
jgi:hypothetical protein